MLRKLYKNGQIYIPKKISNQLNIVDGSVLSFDIMKDKIVINPTNPNYSLNQCTLHGGNITIPSEIRNLLKLNSALTLTLEIDKNTKQLYLRKQNS